MSTVMLLANLLIALDYLLIGILFARRIRFTRCARMNNKKALLAYVCLALFFLLCMHTHLDLAYYVGSGIEHEHWESWPNVLSHVAQGVGGMTFWALARKHLVITITDKKTVGQDEARLQYLAARAGLR